jgi:hypothetical protein
MIVWTRKLSCIECDDPETLTRLKKNPKIVKELSEKYSRTIYDTGTSTIPTYFERKKEGRRRSSPSVGVQKQC